MSQTSQPTVTSQPQTAPKPFLKWAGGKSRLIPQYTTYFPANYQTYYEPFLGGGAIFFYLQPNPAFLSDINSELINAYQCVRNHTEALISRLEQHQQHHNQGYYYQMRSQKFSNSLDQAARLIYLNKTCFNGLYRENRQGQFNVPMGKYKNPKICPRELLITASKTLQSATLKVQSFEAIVNEANSAADFVYFDPPYHPLSPTSNFTSYSHHKFGVDEQEKLAEIFGILHKRGVKVMLSNSDTELIRDLYKDFNIHPIQAGRAINSNPQNRGKITELLITSY
ncbi:MAG: DNA adenine methylase [Arthrospira sp. PLM2.Bin9]|nr:DNA adenine methylase [Arthrospira sp. PLM2.Bin9]TVU54268.1 MAG: DNA adenine methylase [Arthrospira sp. PLM2.Bin9]